MLVADEVSPRFERWIATTGAYPRDPAVRRAGARFLVAAVYLILTARLGIKGPAQWLLATTFVAIPVTLPAVRRVLFAALPFVILAATYDWLQLPSASP